MTVCKYICVYVYMCVGMYWYVYMCLLTFGKKLKTFKKLKIKTFKKLRKNKIKKLKRNHFWIRNMSFLH
jgi:hypothetical protein